MGWGKRLSPWRSHHAGADKVEEFLDWCIELEFQRFLYILFPRRILRKNRRESFKVSIKLTTSRIIFSDFFCQSVPIHLACCARLWSARFSGKVLFAAILCTAVHSPSRTLPIHPSNAAQHRFEKASWLNTHASRNLQAPIEKDLEVSGRRKNP